MGRPVTERSCKLGTEQVSPFQPHRFRMSNRFRQLLLVITPVTLVVGVMIAAVITYLMPKQYETFAVIEPMFLP